VIIDELGLFERPFRAGTWTSKGQAPILQYSFSWKQILVIASVGFARSYFRLFAGSIFSSQIVEFLKALTQSTDRKLLIL
jgi:hypothetical protein